jgi:hypothetical protein
MQTYATTTTLTLPVYTAAEFLNAFEPQTIDGMPDLDLGPDDAFADETKQAGKVAVEGGLALDRAGRYPALVWFSVYP